MSANAQIVSVMLILTLAAAALRVATGPIVATDDRGSLYALAKAGPAPGPLAAGVELAGAD